MTLSKFTRPHHYIAQEDQVPEKEEEQDPLPQAQPQMEQQYEEPRAQRQNVPDSYVDEHMGYLVCQNNYIINALRHQQQFNANVHAHQAVMVDQINAMAAHMYINTRM